MSMTRASSLRIRGRMPYKARIHLDASTRTGSFGTYMTPLIMPDKAALDAIVELRQSSTMERMASPSLSSIENIRTHSRRGREESTTPDDEDDDDDVDDDDDGAAAASAAAIMSGYHYGCLN